MAKHLRRTGRAPMIALGLALGFSETAVAAGLLFEDTRLPANYPQVKGSPSWSLQAVVVRVDDGQRRPLAAFIHGTPATNPRPMLHVAKEFARRGFTAVAVMQPGYGSSEGNDPPADCRNYRPQEESSAQTL